MASAYKLIKTHTTTSSVSSVLISTIPQSFQDLKLVVSARSSAAQEDDALYVKFNSAATTYYSQVMFDNGGSVYGFRLTSAYAGVITANTSDANIFSNSDIYIAGYASSTKNKAAVTSTTNETTSSNIRHDQAQLNWRSTAPITELLIEAGAGNIMSGSTFYLYGISNS
jgi:hypothetical protein